MRSSLYRGSAFPNIICTQLIRWSTVSFLTASSLSAFATVSEAEVLAQEPTSSETSSITNPANVTSANLVSRSTLKLGSQGRDVAELQATLTLLGFYAGEINGVYGESTAIAVSRFQTAAGLPTDGIVGTATWNQLFPLSPPNVAASSTKPITPTTANPTSSSSLALTSNSAAAFPVPQIPSLGNPNSRRSTVAGLPTSPTSGSENIPDRSGTSTTSSDADTSTVELPVLRFGMQGSAVSRLQERLQAAGFFEGVVDGVFGPATQIAVTAAQRQYQLEADGIVGPATWSALLR